MDHTIHTFPKPYLSIWNGYVMGGGVGISIHGRFRVATENTVFSMPECSIGLYPDVGTCYYLARCPHNIGFFVGLTGIRIGGLDCLFAGFATHFVPSTLLTSLLHDFKNSTDSLALPFVVDSILRKYAVNPFANSDVPVSDSLLHSKRAVIEYCFGGQSVEDIFSRLEERATSDPWAQTTLEDLKTKSPSSLKITFESIRRARFMNIDECLRMDFRVSVHILTRNECEFREGVRARIIERDNKPRWHPPTLEELPMDHVQQYYFDSPLEQELQFASLNSRL